MTVDDSSTPADPDRGHGTAPVPRSGADTSEAVTEEVEPAPPPKPALRLRDPLPPVIADEDSLARYCAQVEIWDGPVALDAERASGYRYSQRAYLVQVRREGAGTALIDPIAFEGLGVLDDAIGDSEWILHAATQDLPCLHEIGMHPRALFDTELAGRLLNLPRVGLATLVEHYLGLTLAKEHSAADWSTRPLPEPWLEYAALDVEVLIELRNLVDADLERQGKREWAQEEFDALLGFTAHPVREEGWRRTSGIHRVRGRRMLALVRALWEHRDAIARQRDVTPGRIIPDAGLLEIAKAQPRQESDLRALRSMRGRGPRRFMDDWLDAIDEALSLPEDELPTSTPQRDGPPPPRAWTDKFPDAAARLGAARSVVTQLAEQHDLPAENLLSPGYVRALAWEPPTAITPETVAEALRESGARPWQIGLTSGPLAESMASLT